MYAEVTTQAVNCVRGGATVRNNAPQNCQPGHRRQARVNRGNSNAASDLHAGSHKCMAAKNRAKEFVENDVGANCRQYIDLEGACAADNFPNRNDCPQ